MELTKEIWMDSTEGQKYRLCVCHNWPAAVLEWAIKDGNLTEGQKNLLCACQNWPADLLEWGVKEGALTEYQKDRLCAYQSWPADLIEWAVREGALTEGQQKLLCQYQPWPATLLEWAVTEGNLMEYQKNLLYACQVKITPQEAASRARQYAKRHGLEIKDGCLFAYRNHDKWGRGQYYKNRYYRKGQTYTDWHCDPRPEIENSFGLGIWPEGNTLVSVPLEKFGVEVNRADGKARVWEFTVISCSRTL